MIITMAESFWQNGIIRLRALEPGDAQLFFAWNMDSERARLLDFLWPPQSIESVSAWTQRESLKRLDEDRFHWIIENNVSEPVGSISTHGCDAHSGNFSYGIDIAAAHRNKGFAQAAIRLVLRYYFSELRYQKVTVNIHADNQASIALHVKLGFCLEGQLRRMIFTQGKYVDLLYYGMTAEEFFASC